MTRLTLLLVSFLTAAASFAQNATISRFRFWTADTAFSIWSDTSTVFLYTAPDGSKASIPTADTIYNYTVAKLNKRLDAVIAGASAELRWACFDRHEEPLPYRPTGSAARAGYELSGLDHRI